VHRTTDFAYAFQRPIAQLHSTKLDHTRVQAKRLPHAILCLARSIVSHDEVVAISVEHLMLGCLLGEVEDAPILNAANCTTGVEDE